MNIFPDTFAAFIFIINVLLLFLPPVAGTYFEIKYEMLF